jgi:hypothetical protein
MFMTRLHTKVLALRPSICKLEDDVVGCGHVCQIFPFMSDQENSTDGKNHPLPIPHSPREIISMDFMI